MNLIIAPHEGTLRISTRILLVCVLTVVWSGGGGGSSGGGVVASSLGDRINGSVQTDVLFRLVRSSGSGSNVPICADIYDSVVMAVSSSGSASGASASGSSSASHVTLEGMVGETNSMAPSMSSSTPKSPKPLCSNTTTCCDSSLIPPLLYPKSLHSNSTQNPSASSLLLSTFNNSFKFSTFKSQITEHAKQFRETYESVVIPSSSTTPASLSTSSYSASNNGQLWNSTIHGLGVLKEWGIKYFDTLFLYDAGVFSEECGKRVVENWICYACGGGAEVREVKPCKTLCHNTVIGCLKSPLAEYIESPWKHAVNSVRTAVRLIMTTSRSSHSNSTRSNQNPPSTKSQQDYLQSLINDLNDWREPISWWLDDYKSSRACEGLPSTNCWNGEAVGKYDYPSVTWRSATNPEFSSNTGSTSVSNGGSSADSGVSFRVDPKVVLELDRFRSELVFVRKSLEKFWPTAAASTSSSLPPHALPLSSLEDSDDNSDGGRGRRVQHRPPASSIHDGQHDLAHYEGSGDGFDEADDDEDDDLEYNHSGDGAGRHHIHVADTSDDEDLVGGGGLGEGSGSGDGGDNPVVGDIGGAAGKSDRPPVGMNEGGSKGGSGSVRGGLLCLLLVVVGMFVNYL